MNSTPSNADWLTEPDAELPLASGRAKGSFATGNTSQIGQIVTRAPFAEGPWAWPALPGNWNSKKEGPDRRRSGVPSIGNGGDGIARLGQPRPNWSGRHEEPMRPFTRLRAPAKANVSPNGRRADKRSASISFLSMIFPRNGVAIARLAHMALPDRVPGDPGCDPRGGHAAGSAPGRPARQHVGKTCRQRRRRHWLGGARA